MEHSDGRVQENYYDAEGLRHEVRENGKLLQFVYHDGELLQKEGGDNSRTSYHQGPGIEAFRRDGKNYYYHRDEQSSTAFITDQAGKILNCYRYDAFGNEPETTEQLPNRIRYTGQQYDSLTEQYYLRARYYNPLAGRFMQEDVYQGDGLNLYAYCDNNPVTYYDPSGYMQAQNSYEQAKNGEGVGEQGNIEAKKEIGSDTGYEFKKDRDVDLRGQGDYKDALEIAFRKTGEDRENFVVTEWGENKNEYGKSVPVEYRSKTSYAEVNMDYAHTTEGAPDVPHIGYRTGERKHSDGATVGHIFVDDVPSGRQ